MFVPDRPPPIVVNQGDTLTVHAFNGLESVGTTLHSHGNYFNGSNYYDGAAAVTQCPIPPGETLVYEIPVNDQWGTYWIHVSVYIAWDMKWKPDNASCQ